MHGSSLNNHSVESYVTSHLGKGYYLLATDIKGRWYWAPAHADDPDQVLRADFYGPCSSRGDAIMAGEDWVEATYCPPHRNHA